MPDNNNAGGAGEQQQQTQEQQGQGLTFEAWVTNQPDEIRAMLEGHTSGLRTALSSERDARKAMEKQLKDLAGKAEKGSEFEKQLSELASQQAALEQRAEFFEQAHGAGVTNLKLAYIVATQDGLIDQRGRVNWDGIKKSYPELFGQSKSVAGNAGAGTASTPAAVSMNDFIRAASGRKP